MNWQLVASLLGGLALTWVALVSVLLLAARREQRPGQLREALRLGPDIVRLLRRLTGDRSLPRRLRVGLGVLLGYLLMPIDLVPDFIPVIGWADDAVIAVLALRWVVRAAGPGAVTRHWPGTPDGLRAVRRLAGLRDVT